MEGPHLTQGRSPERTEPTALCTLLETSVQVFQSCLERPTFSWPTGFHSRLENQVLQECLGQCHSTWGPQTSAGVGTVAGQWQQKYEDWRLASKTFYNPLTLLPKVASKHIISKLVSWSREYPVWILSDAPGEDPRDVSGKLVRHCETMYWSIRDRKYKNISLSAGSSP